MVRKARYPLLVASVVLSFVLSVGTAVAQSTVWNAAKEVVPASTVGAVRINVAALRSTSLFTRYVPQILDKQGDGKTVLQDIQRLCHVDVLNQLDDVVIVAQQSDKAGIYVKIRDVDEKKVTACFIAVAKAHNEAMTAKKTGNVVEYTNKGSSKKIYVGWLTPDVAVIASDASDRNLLVSMMQKTTTGFMASADTKKALSSVDMNGIAWGILNHVAQLTAGATTKGGYGSISAAAGTLSTKVTIRLGSAQQATSFATEANTQLVAAKKQLPPVVANIAKTAKIAASGDAVVVTASATEADLGTVITFLLGG
jgi:hypothetical protein